MVTKFLGLNKPRSYKYGKKKKRKRKKNKITCIQSFLCMMALGNKTVAHTWLPSFDNENGRLCQDPEILLIRLDWLSLDKRFSKIMTLSVDTQYISSVTIVVTFVSSPNSSQQRFSRADWRRVSCCTVVMWPLILNQYNQSTLQCFS